MSVSEIFFLLVVHAKCNKIKNGDFQCFSLLCFFVSVFRKRAKLFFGPNVCYFRVPSALIKVAMGSEKMQVV